MDFIEIYKKKLETHIDIKGFESKSTGLKVHVADVDSAMYNAYFCLATEAHSDDGLPHTLEHLIFLGSSKYPYKGSLDIVSNRNFARGTNAWTDVDHTCYTIEVASFQGFINIMDIYLDHILNASITKEGFITEVHHITNDGDDGGVVYCEMQQTENTSECLTEEEMLRTLYDEKCGYRYNTGGKMVNLRHTTTHEKIVDYHKKFYHPQNLSIIVTGKINSAEIEKMLNSLEDCFKTGILSKKMENYTKPWSTLPNQMTSHISHINFPSDTETHGNIRIAWRVCPESDNITDLCAIETILLYLTEPQVSLLSQTFVESLEGICGSLDYQVRRLTSSYYCVSFDEVNTNKMNFVVAKSFKILKDIVNGIIKIDVNHLKNLILRKYANELAAIESDPHSYVVNILIMDILYGDDSQDQLSTILNIKKLYLDQLSQNLDYWINIINKHFVMNEYACVNCKPSINMRDVLAQRDKERIFTNQIFIGREGLLSLTEDLRIAVAKNSVEPNRDYWKKFVPPLLDTSKIEIPRDITNSRTYTNGDMKGFVTIIDEIQQLSIPFQYIEINTHFTKISINYNTDIVTAEERPLLFILDDLLFGSDIFDSRTNTIIEHSAAIKELNSHLLTYDSGILRNGISQYFNIVFTFEHSKLENALEWLRKIIVDTRFTADRISIICEKLEKDISQQFRDGATLLDALSEKVLYNSGNCFESNIIRRRDILRTLLSNKTNEPDNYKNLLDSINVLRKKVFSVSNCCVSITSNYKLLKTHCEESIIDKILQTVNIDSVDLVSHQKRSINFKYDLVTESPLCDIDRNLICGVGSVDSGYISISIPSELKYDSDNIAAAMLFVEYMIQMEGPLWIRLRGKGFVYNYSLRVCPDQGIINFSIHGASQPFNAFLESKKIFMECFDNQCKDNVFNNDKLVAAKGSFVSKLVKRMSTSLNRADELLVSFITNSRNDYNKWLIKSVEKLTISDVYNAGSTHFSPLFNHSISRITVCVNSCKVDKMIKKMKGTGITLKRYNIPQ